VFSAPASDVVFDGTDELAAVLPSFEIFLALKAVRRMILTAAEPVGRVSFPAAPRTSSLKGDGLEERSAETQIDQSKSHSQTKIGGLIQADQVAVSRRVTC
jgi:hypothetical protein